MQIVSEIAEEYYEQMKNTPFWWSGMKNCILNGKPLPKGHGRLIDAYEIIEQVNNMADELDNDYTIADIEKVGTLLESISTIIEADKAGKEQE